MSSALLAHVRPAAGAPTYLYELAYTVPKGDLGSPHGSDNPLIFGNFRVAPPTSSTSIPWQRTSSSSAP
jgi:carboxylesterase type B